MKKNVCATHGELNEANAYVCVSPTSKSGIRLRCKACCNDRRIKQYYLNQDENIKKSVEWKKENREYVRENAKKNYHKDILSTRIKEASRKKGVDIERYKEMLLNQDNKCAICKQPETRRVKNSEEIANLCIDHCHKTMKVRALLCFDCNVGLGKFHDNPVFMRAAADFVEEHAE